MQRNIRTANLDPAITERVEHARTAPDIWHRPEEPGPPRLVRAILIALPVSILLWIGIALLLG